jgi:hypothetical protein
MALLSQLFLFHLMSVLSLFPSPFLPPLLKVKITPPWFYRTFVHLVPSPLSVVSYIFLSHFVCLFILLSLLSFIQQSGTEFGVLPVPIKSVDTPDFPSYPSNRSRCLYRSRILVEAEVNLGFSLILTKAEDGLGFSLFRSNSSTVFTISLL